MQSFRVVNIGNSIQSAKASTRLLAVETSLDSTQVKNAVSHGKEQAKKEGKKIHNPFQS